MVEFLPPRNPGLLQKVQRFLELHKWKTSTAFADQNGTYGLLMVDLHENPCYLVAKGSRIFKNTVSVQSALLAKALESGKAIVMAHLEGSKPVEKLAFYAFNPADCQANSLGENERAGVFMTNFPFDLAKPLKVTDDTLQRIRTGRDGQVTLT